MYDDARQMWNTTRQRYNTIKFLIGFRIGPPKIHGPFRIGLPKMHRRFCIGPPKTHIQFRIGPPQVSLDIIPKDFYIRGIM